MACEHKKEGGICCGKTCFSEKEFRTVAQMCIDAETVSRVRQKAAKIDALLEKDGKAPMFVQALGKSLCPHHRSDKSAQVAQRIEKLIDPILGNMQIEKLKRPALSLLSQMREELGGLGL